MLNSHVELFDYRGVKTRTKLKHQGPKRKQAPSQNAAPMIPAASALASSAFLTRMLMTIPPSRWFLAMSTILVASASLAAPHCKLFEAHALVDHRRFYQG